MTSDKTGRTVEVFTQKPGRPDNHWLDGTVGCMVAASIDGCELEIPGVKREPPRQRFGGMEFSF